MASHPAVRDLAVSGLILALGGLLISEWHQGFESYSLNIAAQMTSFWLLPALGLFLVLQEGGIDLSVWATAALAGVVGVVVMDAGASPVYVLLAGAAVGGVLGGVNALLVCRFRLPSPVVTLLLGGAVVIIMQIALRGERVTAESETMLTLHQKLMVSPVFLRMMLVSLAYLAIVFGMLGVRFVRSGDVAKSRRGRLAVFLVISGLASGWAGACWLTEWSWTPVPSFPINDLRPVAAAVLAGGLVLSGRGRWLLGALFLPPSLLVATMWRQLTWDLLYQGFALQLLWLIAGALLVQLSLVRAGRKATRRRNWFRVAFVLAGVGLAAMTMEAHLSGALLRTTVHWIGAAGIALSAATVLCRCLLERREWDKQRSA
ncbi:MAG: hypothetical protein ACLFVU_02735 [Phycisphaerae bacterium]